MGIEKEIVPEAEPESSVSVPITPAIKAKPVVSGKEDEQASKETTDAVEAELEPQQLPDPHDESSGTDSERLRISG